MNFSDYYLDMNLVFKLDKDQASLIVDFYNRMLDIYPHDKESSTSFFNTLVKSGYLKNKNEEERDEKIGDLING